jgi:hypothetical protein
VSVQFGHYISIHDPDRIDALDHFFTLHLGQASIMSSRNVHKLRAHIRGKDYDAQPGHALDSGEER